MPRSPKLIVSATGAAVALVASLGVGVPAASAADPVPVITGLDTEVRAPVGSRPSDDITVDPVTTTIGLERRSAGAWQSVRTFRPDSSGDVTLQYPPTELGLVRYRVVPAAATNGVAGAQVVTVTGFRKNADVDGWTTATQILRKGTPQIETLSGVPAGATVTAERRPGAGQPWQVVGSAVVGKDGDFRLDLGAVVEGTSKYRIVVPRQDLVGERWVSNVRTVTGYGRVPPTALLPQLLNRLLVPLGIPKVRFTRVSSDDTARAACVAAELSGQRPKRSQPGRQLRAKLLSTTAFTQAPVGMTNGVNVSVRCQAAYFVQGRKLLRAVPVSTGRKGYPTDLGTYRVFRTVNGTETSNEFPDDHWNMYRSLYFNGGEAMHGAWSDSYVYPYPASHGCVRMLHRDIDWLWRNGWTVGTQVRVYGSWR